MVGGHKVAGRSEDCGAVEGFCENAVGLKTFNSDERDSIALGLGPRRR